MYFGNLLSTVAFATLASAAVAKQIRNPYTSGESDSNIDNVYERDAEADPARTAAWEQAHGGPAPSYKYGEEHDAGAWHVAREANPMPEAEPEPGWANVNGHRQKKPGNWASWLSSGVKKVIPTVKPFATKGGLKKGHGVPLPKTYHAREADGAEFEGFDDEDDFEDLVARDVNLEALEIPDFGDQEVDTSLEGLLQRRDFEGDNNEESDSEEPYDDSQVDLSGYDPEIVQRRSDGTADEVDYSLEGYDAPEFADDDDDEEDQVRQIQARDLDEATLAADDDYLHSDEHRAFLASHGVTERSVEDDLEDAEHDRLDARGLHDIDEADIQVPDFGDLDVDTSLAGLVLGARDVEAEDDDGDDGPYFGDEEVDVSLEGYDEHHLHARGADEEEEDYEEIEDADDKDSNADAAYAGSPVVEDLTAPAEPELHERDDIPPTRINGKPVSSSRGFFRIPWT